MALAIAATAFLAAGCVTTAECDDYVGCADDAACYQSRCVPLCEDDGDCDGGGVCALCDEGESATDRCFGDDGDRICVAEHGS